ncbi:hypothetical protein C1Y63_07840 [Corynebacterium sp. 13CS0277]|uniref:cell division protein FtsQ/DivIB n=1 Tax=Corynebacterium sp. 13CS0277 TaxID=2071994 RepID=UPI000D032E2F|nr:FtsQ-type POTRA domain-containing protein [Corynebacterium sp. 13CS0277]PRQ11155.1 hypothetical protein C1Y63_07840 [Corynebacterium sp. 13CS0277]
MPHIPDPARENDPADIRVDDAAAQRAVEEATGGSGWRQLALRTKIAFGAGALIVAGVIIGVLLMAVPVLQVRTITVEGNTNTPYQQVVDATGIQEGDNLLRIDMGQAVRNVVALPWVVKAEIHQHAPDTVDVTVQEHEPLLFLRAPEGEILVDTKGAKFVIAAPPAGTVEVIGTDGEDQQVLQAAAHVVASLAPEVRAQVEAIDITSPERITLRCTQERSVYWGSSEDAEHKARVTATVLTQPGQEWNVSDPYLVTRKD